MSVPAARERPLTFNLQAPRARAFEAGFDAHITKPASADKILRALYASPDDDPRSA